MINCSECLPTVEESLYEISKNLDSISGLLGVLLILFVIVFIIQLLRVVNDCTNFK